MKKTTIIILIIVLVILGIAAGVYYLTLPKCIGADKALQIGQQCCQGLNPSFTETGKMICVSAG